MEGINLKCGFKLGKDDVVHYLSITELQINYFCEG